MKIPFRSFGGTPKLRNLCARVHQMALELGPGAQLPTALSLREELGISMATLNSALRELEAHHVIVRRHGVGMWVSPHLHQKTVALLCESSFLRGAGQSPFWDLLLETARARATSHHELLELHLVAREAPAPSPLQRGLSGEIESGQISGIIGIGLSENASRWIEARRVPFVALFGPHFSASSASVNIDVESLVAQGARALREAGCARVGIWSPVARDEPLALQARDALFEQVLGAHGMAIEPSLLQPENSQVPELSALSAQEQGFEIARRVFSGPRASWPDGLLITDDTMTRGALAALRALDVEIGRDVYLATHANRNSPTLPALMLRAAAPANAGAPASAGVTLLEIDPAEIVEMTFALLETLMSGQMPPRRETWVRPRTI